MCHYKHLSIKERESLLLLINANKKITEIAKILWRNASTISRELKRNSSKKGYSAVDADEKYLKRRINSKRHRLFDNEELRQKVLELFLEKQWSPEQISQRHKFENSQFQVSYNTIYRAIYDNSLKKHDTPRQRGLTLKLRHKGKTRHKGNAEENRGKFPVSHPLSERPKEADDRQTIGHFEADTVLGKIGSVCLVTVVDRASRFLFAKKSYQKHCFTGK